MAPRVCQNFPAHSVDPSPGRQNSPIHLRRRGQFLGNACSQPIRFKYLDVGAVPEDLQRDFGMVGDFDGACEHSRFINGIHLVFMPTLFENSL